MKCIKCNSEWTTKEDISKCPFCGANLIDGKSNEINVYEALKQIISLHGIDVLLSPKLVISLVADFVMGYEREKKLIKIASSAGVFEEVLLISKEDHPEQRKLLIQKSRQKLMTDMFFSEDASNEVLSILLFPLGITIEGDKKDISISPVEDNSVNAIETGLTDIEQPKSYSELCRMAESGSSHAKYVIGFCYEYGVVVESDLDEAEKWLREAISEGCWIAKYDLARVLYAKEAKSNSKEKNISLREETAKLFVEMADEGHIQALYYCGSCYSLGFGISKNVDKQFEYFDLASNPSNTTSNTIIDFYNEVLQMVLYIHEIKSEFEKYVSIYMTDVKYGNASALRAIASEYQKASNYFKKQDLEKSFMIFKELADREDPMSYFELGYCYQHGFGTEKDMDESDKWYTVGETMVKGLTRVVFHDIIKS